MLVKVKMPRIVAILTFINMIHITSESLKARIVFIFQHFNIFFNMDIVRQSASLVVNLITVYSYGALFYCTTVGPASGCPT